MLIISIKNNVLGCFLSKFSVLNAIEYKVNKFDGVSRAKNKAQI